MQRLRSYAAFTARTWDVLIFIMCYVKSRERIYLFVKMCMNYLQAINSMKLMVNEVYSDVHSYHEGKWVAVEKELNNCVIPLGFLVWEIQVTFPATQPTMHPGCFGVSITLRTLTGTTGSLNVPTDVDAYDCTREVYGHSKRVCTESWLWQKNPLLHWGIKPASVMCWSDSIPTELHPHPKKILSSFLSFCLFLLFCFSLYLLLLLYLISIIL